MDLHNIVSGAIGTINPFISAEVYQSSGYTTAGDGSRTPTYAAAVDLQIQKQELSFKELKQIEGLNLQGIFCTVYLEGQIFGVDRGTAKGGDKFVFNSQTWLVVAVPEQWPDWCKVILCLQVTS